MKVLWITNILFAHHYEMMGVKGKATGGSWLYAAYEESLKDKELIKRIGSNKNGYWEVLK